MKNKIKLKKYLVSSLIVSFCLIIMFLILNICEYKTYTINFNEKIGAIINLLNLKYPELTDKEIIEILNSEEFKEKNFFVKYGIDVDRSSIVIINDKSFHKFLVINISFLTIVIAVLLILFIMYNRKKEKDIESITKYIEEINKKNYELQIDSISEDELSILRNEIYKNTVMLKEAAENSYIDKINLKKSLEDISHQLKTPLTSILIMLDNIIEEPDMEKSVREDFIRDIKRNVMNINFFVNSILKLSKFDANTVHFLKEETLISDIVSEAIKNVSTLCDLRNISIETNYIDSSDDKIVCDKKWQVEAISNILKNSIDHSKDNAKIIINVKTNNAYSMIEIIDYGDGISKEDLPHIFERFYKGQNACTESVGIGLALSKTIIEEDNGTINVSSNENGTKFVIKYFKI